MNPYYRKAGITLFLGDAREVLPTLAPADVVITDPVWPNSLPSLVEIEERYCEVAARRLSQEVFDFAPQTTEGP